MTNTEMTLGSGTRFKNQIDPHLIRNAALAGSAGFLAGGFGGAAVGIVTAFASASVYCMSRLYSFGLKADERGVLNTKCAAVGVAALMTGATFVLTPAALHLLSPSPEAKATNLALKDVARGASQASATVDVKRPIPFQWKWETTGTLTVSAKATGTDDKEGCEIVRVSVPNKPDKIVPIYPRGNGAYTVCG